MKASPDTATRPPQTQTKGNQTLPENQQVDSRCVCPRLTAGWVSRILVCKTFSFSADRYHYITGNVSR